MRKTIYLVFLAVFTMASAGNVFADNDNNEKKWYDTLRLSGMMRIRPEIKSNNGFVDGRANTSDFIAQKTWVTLMGNPLTGLGFKITLQDARIWGGESGSIGGVSTQSLGIGLREAYFDAGFAENSPFHLLLGRQKISFGDQRLFGALDWSNVGRSFDAVQLTWKNDSVDLHLWGSVLTEYNAGDLPLTSAYQGLSEIYYNGIYNTMKFGSLFLLDVYYADKIDARDSTTLKLHALGARFTNRTDKGKTANDFPFDFTAEGTYEFGLKNSKTVSAYAAALALGFTFNAGIKIRLGAEGDIASGDSNAADNKVETFDNLFHTNHMHYGQADMISWQNMLAFSGNIGFIFSQNFSAKVAYWYLSRLVSTDSWYGVAGGSSTNDAWIGASKALFLAHEVDITLKGSINRYLALEGGYSVVLTGQALQDAGKTVPYHYGYVAATMKF